MANFVNLSNCLTSQRMEFQEKRRKSGKYLSEDEKLSSVERSAAGWASGPELLGDKQSLGTCSIM